MDLLVAKIITIVILLVISLTFGLIPIKLVHWLKKGKSTDSEAQCGWKESRSRADYVLGLLNCAAGGIFLATCLLHLFPEVEEAVVRMLSSVQSDTDFPLALFLVGCGFFLVMVVEHTVMQLQHHLSGVRYEESGSHTHDEHTHISPTKQHADQSATCYGTMTRNDESTHTEEDGLLHKVYHNQVAKLQPDTGAATNRARISITQDDEGCVHVIHPSHHQHHHLNPQQLHGLRSFVLLLALSLHMVFEGLALGLLTVESQLWTLLGAVALHKAIIAFTTGLQFAENISNTRKVVIFVMLYSIMAPFGVAIGTIVRSTGSTSADIVAVALQGVASGTFLYVTFFEVLQKEVGQDHSVVKVLIILLGFGAIATMKLFLPG